jgi:N-methylhydantoinase B
MNATIAMNDGDTHNSPSEQLEAKFPVLVERYCLRPDSGGAGRYRGGLGTEKVVQALNLLHFSSQMDRVKCKPWGLSGGMSGFGNGVALHRFGKTEETHFPNGKALNQTLQSGDAFILRSGGGGGYGSPLERDLATLERDVRRGYVSRKSAEENYGVVFAGDALEIDAAATARNREDMRAKGLPYDNPIAETLIPFAAPPAPQSDPAHAKLTQEERVAFAMQCRCCT